MPRYKLPETSEDQPAKPLVFGSSAWDTDRLDDFQFAAGHYDASYVPGYHEAVVENEMRVKEGKLPIPTPKLQWVRIKKTNAADYVSLTDEGMVEWVRLGYQPMGVADLERYGYGWPPSAGSGPNSDGLICRGGDLALFFVDEDRAARNRRDRDNVNYETSRDALEKVVEVKDRYRGGIEPLPDERTDEEGKFFLGDLNTPSL